MDFLLYSKYLVVLIFVLGLIGLITVVIRKFGFVPSVEKTLNKKKRLAISQMIGLDAKRRLVLIRRDDREHLLLLGPDGDLVIERDIPMQNLSNTEPVEEGEPDMDQTSITDETEPRLPTLSPISHRKEDAQ
ncbi:hypothetical protein A9Q83_16190 [Alphaproteobacteria bacterium 46_93_T64]|nr:hypothetical protein A9Q83_16190 [Alphaproteobacteria bacterium 46_93_T64]